MAPSKPGIGMLPRLGIEVVGETIEAAGAAVGGALAGAGAAIGGAAQGIGSAIGGALQGALTEGPKTIVNNVGIAGTAGAGKVKTGGGTLPAPKKTAKPAYNEKMPTEKLLAVAVGYLQSIDNTLRTQIENDRLIQQKQVQAEKEAIIEGKDESPFKRLGDSLGVTKEKTSNKWDIAKSLIVPASIIAGLGAIGINQLDTSEFDELKQNIQAFREEYGWLSYLGAAVAGAGIGRKAGPYGALVGAIGGMAVEYILEETPFGERFGQYLTPGRDARPEGDQRGGLFSNSIIGDISIGMGARWIYNQAKRGVGWTVNLAKSQWSRLKTAAAWLWDTSFVKFVKTAATNPRRWARFLTWLERHGGRLGIEVAGRIASLIAIEALTSSGEAAVAATGVGAPVAAVVAVIDKIIAAGFFMWMVYDLYQLFRDFLEWEEANPELVNGQTVVPGTVQDTTPQNAARINAPAPSTGITARSETGRPEEAQAFFEGKGWTKEQAAGIVGNLFVESGLRTDAIGDSGQAYGIAQWHPDRQAIFQTQFGKPIRQSNFQEQLEFVNWELNNTERAAGAALRSAPDAASAAAIVDRQYERSSGAAIAARQQNAINIAGGNYADLQGGGGSAGGTVTAVIESTLEVAKKIFGAAGGALIGAQNYAMRPITSTESGPSRQITDLSRSIEVDTIAGHAQQVAKAGPIAALASQQSIVQASNDGTLGALDPNYPNGSDLIATYLAHWKVAA